MTDFSHSLCKTKFIDIVNLLTTLCNVDTSFMQNNAIEIERGIEIPEKPLHHRAKYPFKNMAVGDSIFVPSEEDGGKNIRAAAYSHARKNPEFKWFIAESVRNSVLGWRVWRVPVVDQLAAVVVDEEDDQTEYDRNKEALLAEMRADKEVAA